jgi:O-antigen ligase
MASSSAVPAALVLARPSVAWFWLLVAAIAVPVRFDHGLGPFTTLSLVDLALLLCAAYFALQFACLQVVQIGPGIVALAVVVPAAVAAVSIGWAAEEPLAVAGAIKYFYAALIYFVGLQAGSAVSGATFGRALALVLLAWLAGSAAMYLDAPGFSFFRPQSLDSSDPGLLDFLTSLYTRLGHPYIGQSNDYGPLLAFVGFILLGYGRTSGARWLVALAGLAFLASVLTFSRGLLAGLVLSLIAYAALSRIGMGQLLVPVGMSVLVLSVIVWVAGDVSISVGERDIELVSIVESRLSEANIEARLEGYRDALESIADKAWLGYGAGYYDVTRPDSFLSVHNAFLEQWLYFGVVLGSMTAACYVAIMVYFFSLRTRAGHWSRFSDALACAWLCLIVASLFETFFEATTPRAIIYLLLGLSVSLCTNNLGNQQAVNTRLT